MLDTITLPGNLVIGFRVLNAPKSMLKNRFHLILESAFHFNWRISKLMKLNVIQSVLLGNYELMLPSWGFQERNILKH
jgi:hypothetical protein